jgi:ATP/maltotriose-dependent transcriptional regulator MalT
VLDGPDGSTEDSGHLQVIKARFMLLRNRPTDAVAAAEAVIEGGEVSQAVFGAAEVTRLFALLTEGELRYARPLAEALLAGTDDRGGAAAFVGALTTLALIAWTDGHVADALGLVRAAVRRSGDAPAGSHRVHALLTLAMLLASTGDFEEADDLIELARDDEGHPGEPLWTALVPYARARVHLAAGRLSDAVDEAHHSLSLAEAVGATIAVPANEWVLASVSLLGGDLDEAAAHVQRYTAGAAPVDLAPSSATYRFTAARVAEARGDDAAAARLFDRIYADPVSRAQLFAVDPTSAPCLVRRALRAGDRQAAAAVVAQAQLISAGSPGVTALDAGAAHARGVVVGDVDALDDAARRHRFPWGRASALEDGAAVLTTRDAVRARLEGSLSGYEEMGAMRDADRVRARLDQADRRPRRAQKPVEGWASLTDTERRVSRLVARGLTNSDVAQSMTLSRHTVDYHLRVVFRKLHINSRVELTRLTLSHDEG